MHACRGWPTISRFMYWPAITAFHSKSLFLPLKCLDMEKRIQGLLQEVTEFVASDKQSLESFRMKFISKKGAIGELFEELKQLPPEAKKLNGKILNDLKKAAESRFAEMSQNLETSKDAGVAIDLTLPPVPNKVGNLHPLTLTKYRIIEIFERLGFNVADGPEIEDDWHNFSALNFPPNHPARERKQIKKEVTFFSERTLQTSRSGFCKTRNLRSGPLCREECTETKPSPQGHTVSSTRSKVYMLIAM
jgi:phenylalanyl-tRNA synthetase alpha subunit